MGYKSRQHYVPKFYLKNFSNTEASIGTFNLLSERYIKDASIRNMCQKNNFYGADKKMEEFLAKEIESGAAKIIETILMTNEFPSDLDEYQHLLAFLLVSEARNLKMADSQNKMVDYIAKVLLEGDPEFRKEGIDLDTITIGLKEPANHMIEFALESVKMVADLEPLLIQATGARTFITSDNPLIRYNPFYLDNDYPGGFGYMGRGLMLFFPIAHDKCILLYDRIVYDIPGAKDNVLSLNKARDIDRLNDLFYLNAYNNLFFSQRTPQTYIENLHHSNKKYPKLRDLSREVKTMKQIDSPNEIIHFANNRVTNKIKFSWLKYKAIASRIPIPKHMGGVNRMENPFIRAEVLSKNN
jgi:hypothetical protein